MPARALTTGLVLLALVPACKVDDDPATTSADTTSEATTDSASTTTDSGTSGTDTSSDAELPEGWADAVAIELAQAPMTGGCDNLDAGMSLAAGLVEGRTQAVIDGLTIGCGEGYEGFVRPREGGGYDLLVQPIDMHPAGLAGCVCRTRLRGVLDPSEALDAIVDIYQRPSFEEDPSGTVNSLGSATVEGVAVGCATLEPCDSQTPCANLGNEDPSEYWDECVQVAGCGASVCVSHAEGCMIDCGVLGCEILESDPAQLGCGG